jgi:hypothetical protein
MAVAVRETLGGLQGLLCLRGKSFQVHAHLPRSYSASGKRRGIARIKAGPGSTGRAATSQLSRSVAPERCGDSSLGLVSTL